MKYHCWLCMVSPRAEDIVADRETVRAHIEENHNVMDIESYLYRQSGEQTTLSEVV